ncbi:hypothetical protein LCGC14_1919470 [marine sediment metagenome]|uniref:Uncharacterized protein n=1 Tax=marine sediment metagenome TaxID=412755 RepID=A0A0F9I578_9ZZZZ
MTSNLNIGDLARIAKQALDANTTGQEFMLEDVYNVTRSAYERYPEDPVIKQVVHLALECTFRAINPIKNSRSAQFSGIFVSENDKRICIYPSQIRTALSFIWDIDCGCEDQLRASRVFPG